jgi:hypothetical protein
MEDDSEPGQLRYAHALSDYADRVGTKLRCSLTRVVPKLLA